MPKRPVGPVTGDQPGAFRNGLVPNWAATVVDPASVSSIEYKYSVQIVIQSYFVYLKKLHDSHQSRHRQIGRRTNPIRLHSDFLNFHEQDNDNIS